MSAVLFRFVRIRTASYGPACESRVVPQFERRAAPARGRGPAGRRRGLDRALDRAAARGRQVPVMVSLSPFFAFVLGLVIPVAIVVLLLALLWTRR